MLPGAHLVSTDVRLLLLHLVLTQAVDLIGGKLLHDVLALPAVRGSNPRQLIRSQRYHHSRAVAAAAAAAATMAQLSRVRAVQTCFSARFFSRSAFSGSVVDEPAREWRALRTCDEHSAAIFSVECAHQCRGDACTLCEPGSAPAPRRWSSAKPPPGKLYCRPCRSAASGRLREPPRPPPASPSSPAPSPARTRESSAHDPPTRRPTDRGCCGVRWSPAADYCPKFLEHGLHFLLALVKPRIYPSLDRVRHLLKESWLFSLRWSRPSAVPETQTNDLSRMCAALRGARARYRRFWNTLLIMRLDVI
jgi:hypothetical protein